MNYELEERLNVIRPKAERYAALIEGENTQESRQEQRDIALYMLGCAPLEVAYFCQQFASRIPQNTICDALVVFANRMSRGL